MLLSPDIIAPKASFYNCQTYTKSKFLKPPNLHQKQVSLNHLHYRIGRILFENLFDIDTRSIVIERIITEECDSRLKRGKLKEELVRKFSTSIQARNKLRALI